MPTVQQLTALEFPFSSPNFLFSRYFIFALSAVLTALALYRVAVAAFSYRKSSKSSEIIPVQSNTSVSEAPKATATPAPSPSSTNVVAHKSKWSFGWFAWESINSTSLPLAELHKEHRPQVMTRSSSRARTSPPPPPPTSSQVIRQHVVVQSTRRGAPVFECPLPALYQTPVPLSMAKVIMSRHTYRRPNGYRPRAPSNSTVPTRPSSRRTSVTIV